MSERDLWQKMKKELAPYLLLKRVENAVEAGMPDVCCLARLTGAVSWIELKHVTAFPKKLSTSIALKKLTQQQVTWLKEWREAKGRTWLLVQVADAYFIFDGRLAQQLRDGRSGKWWESHATTWDAGSFPKIEVLRCLSS